MVVASAFWDYDKASIELLLVGKAQKGGALLGNKRVTSGLKSGAKR